MMLGAPPYPADGPAPAEDCLVLNVYTPGLNDGARRPVMFSIHGGGYTSGTSGNPVFDGVALAKLGDVILVTINHRLGLLGPPHTGGKGTEVLESSRDRAGITGGDGADPPTHVPGAGVSTPDVLLHCRNDGDTLTTNNLDTPVGRSDSKDDAAKVAREGWDAVMSGSAHVVAGTKNKVQAAISHITPDRVLAKMHTNMAKPDGE